MIAAVLVVAGAGLLAGGATAAKKEKKPAGQFRQVLSAKLGKELGKPAADVAAALKAAPKPAKAEKPRDKPRSSARPAARRREDRADWAPGGQVARRRAAKVTAAVKALVKQRLDSLVQDGWLTQEQADKRVDKLGVGFLRIR